MKQIIFLFIMILLLITNSCEKYDMYEYIDYSNPPEKLTFTDTRDNKIYKYVKIGNQYWMSENLAYKPVNGIYYNTQYGFLYDYETANEVCPDGWHLPNNTEWLTLINYVGNDGHSGKEGTVLKSTTGWNSTNGIGNGTDSYGFSASPSGFHYFIDNYVSSNGDFAGFWSSTEGYNINLANVIIMDGYQSISIIDHGVKESAYSIRCIKN